VREADRGVALVLLLRNYSAWTMHTYHHYLIACALKKQGYRVVLVRCRGETENCGSGTPGKMLKAPPYRCRECQLSSLSFYDEHFEVVYLDDYAGSREDALVAEQVFDNHRPLEELAVGDLPYGKLAVPYLLRYFQGDRSRITLRDMEVRQHLKGALRMALRYQMLVDEKKPSCTVLFNGLFIPEHLFGHLNRRHGISTLYTERGPRRNSMFISDHPAPHYRLDSVWENEKERIGAEEMEAAARYMESRRQKNEDPAGRHRAIAVDGLEKYRELSAKPYVVFFPPIFYDTVSMEKESCFEDIFDAIEQLARTACAQKARLVIRCHPDEAKRGKMRCYGVKQFLMDRQLIPSEYIICLDATDQWNAYLLAEDAESVVIYNGSLGMELPAIGIRIFNLAGSHYTEKGFTRDIKSVRDMASIFSEERGALSSAERQAALKYLWFYYFRASVDLSHLIDEYEPFRFRFADVQEGPDVQKTVESIDSRVTFLLNRSPSETHSHA
jgi:hypothetical protein